MADAHWDAIVVGSGFGGSVLAYRLAKAGFSVCVLERGKAYPPNSFPRSPIDMRNNFWDPSHGLYGLNNVWSFKGSAALVSSGLGGGSLIYANVLIRKDEKWFDDAWPIKRNDLDPHYAAVEAMMNVQQYPVHKPPFNRTHKATGFRNAATNAGHKPIPLNLAVSFRVHRVSDPDNPDDTGNPPVVGEPIEEPPNLHGMTRNTCRLCGECDIGCNYGSKNTLDFNYLSEAERLGACIRTLAQVETIAPRPNGRGYDVTYVTHDPVDEGRKRSRRERDERPRTQLSCDRLILAAGTMGTTFLLLDNKENFPNLSPALGTGYSTNGDQLAFFVDAEKELKPDFGPVITTGVRYPDTLDGNGDVGRGFYVEDGGNPALFSWMAELSGVFGLLWRLSRFVWLRVKYVLGFSTTTDMGHQLARVIGSCRRSSHAMPVLAMGRDFPTGRFSLRKGILDCDWTYKRSRAYYARLNRELRKLAGGMKARFVENPLFRWRFFQQVLTAHPLGGCPMGRTREQGVVNEWGEVFGHPGLYVADGSAMPGPVGPNPSLTIAAFADRVAHGIIRGTPDTRREENEMPTQDNSMEDSTVRFSEEMKGFVKMGETDPAAGRPNGEPLLLSLGIRTEGIDFFLLDPKHRGSVNGYIRYEPAGSGRIQIESGDIEILADVVPEPDLAGRYSRVFLYNLFFQGRNGPLTLSGIKKIHPVEVPADKAAFLAWTTVLVVYAVVRIVVALPSIPASFGQADRRAWVLFGLAGLMALCIGSSWYRGNRRESFINSVSSFWRSCIASWVVLLAGYTIFATVAAVVSPRWFFLKTSWDFRILWGFNAAAAAFILWTEVCGPKKKSFVFGGIGSLWRDSTTLFVTLFEGHIHIGEQPDGEAVGAGILRIGFLAFIAQLLSFRSDVPTLFRFAKFFLSTLWDLFSAERRQVSDRVLEKGANAIGFIRKIPRYTLEGVKNADISTHALSTPEPDGLGLNILRFLRKECRDVVVLLHGLTTSTDMFIMPEHRNLVSYLLDNGYTDVWSFDWRGSMRYSYDLFPTDFTMDDIALFDMPTAFSHIRKVVGPEARIHVICHCVGSITFMMALYAGQVKGIASVISNSVSLIPVVPLWSRIKLTLAPLVFFRSPVLNPRWSYYPGLFTYGKWLSKLISAYHRLLGDCNVSACHVVSFMWGSGHPATWLHKNLSDITHERTGDLFGAVNFAYYRHIRKMVSRGRAVKMYPNDQRYRELPDEYLKNASAIDTPVFFVTGDQNHEFLDSNIRTFHALNKLKPGNGNALREFIGYSHQDIFMGKNVANEIFPAFLDWLRSH